MPIPNGSEGPSQGDWLTWRRFALLLLALVVVSFPQVIFGWQTFVYRDFGIFSYPLAFHFHECFWRGELPLWNPLNCCGTPFLAQWNTQVLYPPALFYLLLPASWSVGVFCLLSLYWGGLGMFLLAERWTGNRLAAGFAGIVFAFSGLMLSSLIWPATVAGLGWMPWVVWLTERAWRNGGSAVPLAALGGALQMLSGGVEAVLLSWVLLGALWLVDFLSGVAPRGKMAVRAGWVILLIAGLSAAQLLPFFELLDYSRRQEGISAAMWPMSPSGWANFLTPLFHCSSFQGVFMQTAQGWTNSYYAGVATVALAAAALWPGRRDWRVWPMAGLALLCLVLAVGEATPVYGWLVRHFKVVGLMRFPVKFVILPVFVLPLLAAFTLSRRTFWPDRGPRVLLLGGVWLVLVGAILTLACWPQPAWLSGADRQAIVWNGVLRAVYFTALAALWLAAKKISGPGLRWWQLLFLLLVWVDLFQQMPLPRTVNRAVYDPGLPRRWVAPQYGGGRVQVRAMVYDTFYRSCLPDATADYMGRRFALMANCNLLDGIPKCDGFYPLYLSCYAGLFYNFYRDSQPAGPLLDFLGVSQTLVSQDGQFEWQPRSTFLPLLTAGQGARFADGLAGLQMLTNADFNPRREVILPAEAKPFITASNAVAANLGPVTYADQRIEAHLETPAPALVVAAQTYYPAWRAYVDGRPVRLWPANYAFQAFEVPAGAHVIKLVYRDRRFRIGAWISLCTLAGCLICFALKHKPRSSQPLEKRPR
jgi:hypothetical protein